MDPIKKTLALALLMSGMAAGTVQAQTTAPAPATAPAAEAPASALSFNVALYSQYIFRGLSQTDYKPAVQGGIDYAHDSGFYIGTWASNIQWLRDFGISDGRVEWDIYGGWKKTIDDWGIDVGYLRYQYPGSLKSGAISPNTNEVYIAGSYKFVTLKYSHAFSNTFGVAESKHTTYWDLTAAIPIVDTWTLTAHGGYQRFRGPSSDVASYSDVRLEIAKDFGNGLSAGAGYTGTDADKPFYTPVDKKFTGKDTGYVFVKYVF
ncbi:MAG: TorF family putative porin [Casimicrobiaceae bacterium]